MKHKTDISGWQIYSGKIDKVQGNNSIASIHRDGIIYIGQMKNLIQTAGKIYELQNDGTHTLF